MLLVTPQAANRTIGQGGFQEVEQMALFRDMVCYQEEVRDPSRVAEVLNRVILKAKRVSAPAQINIPRDFWTQVIDISLPAVVEFERPAVDRLIATNRDFMWDQKIEGAKFQRIDGGPADDRWKDSPGVLWTGLLPFDATLRKIFEANHKPDVWGGLAETPRYIAARRAATLPLR